VGYRHSLLSKRNLKRPKPQRSLRLLQKQQHRQPQLQRQRLLPPRHQPPQLQQHQLLLRLHRLLLLRPSPQSNDQFHKIRQMCNV
jgi:hypothetical protein